MTRIDIVKGLRLACGGDWINKTQLAKYMNCDRKSDKIRMATKGACKIGNNISVLDIADNIYNAMKVV